MNLAWMMFSELRDAGALEALCRSSAGEIVAGADPHYARPGGWTALNAPSARALSAIGEDGLVLASARCDEAAWLEMILERRLARVAARLEAGRLCGGGHVVEVASLERDAVVRAVLANPACPPGVAVQIIVWELEARAGDGEVLGGLLAEAFRFLSLSDFEALLDRYPRLLDVLAESCASSSFVIPGLEDGEGDGIARRARFLERFVGHSGAGAVAAALLGGAVQHRELGAVSLFALVGETVAACEVAVLLADRLEHDDGRLARLLVELELLWGDRCPSRCLLAAPAAEVFAGASHPKLLSAALESRRLGRAGSEQIARRLGALAVGDAIRLADLLLRLGRPSPTTVRRLVETYRSHADEVTIGLALERFSLGEWAGEAAVIAAESGDIETPARWLAGCCAPNPPSLAAVEWFCRSVHQRAGGHVAALLGELDGSDLANERYDVVAEQAADASGHEQGIPGTEVPVATAFAGLELPGMILAIEDEPSDLCAAIYGPAIAAHAAVALGHDPRVWEVAISLAKGWHGTARELFDTACQLGFSPEPPDHVRPGSTAPTGSADTVVGDLVAVRLVPGSALLQVSASAVGAPR